jgi:predicted peptidase
MEAHGSKGLGAEGEAEYTAMIDSIIRRSGAVVLLALVFPARAALAQQETGFLNRSLPTTAGGMLRYQVFVPAGYTRAREWPVILFLHGAGERGSDGLLQTEVGMGSAIRRHPERFPALVVFPQAPLDSVWRGAPARAAFEMLERTVREFRGDRARLYLAGLSMGGYGSWEMALQHPGTFAAIVAVCGGVAANPKMPALRVTTSGSNPFAWVAEHLTDTPAWIFHGEDDPVVPVTESRLLYAAFQ